MVTAVVIPAGECQIPSVIELDTQLRSFQTLVDGLIQMVTVNDLVFIVDEEGKVKSKPVNRLATDYLYELAPEYRGWDFLVGTVIIVGDTGEDVTSVPARVLEHFELA